MEAKLTVTVEELQSIMDPIVGLFPRRFLWKSNQTARFSARGKRTTQPPVINSFFVGLLLRALSWYFMLLTYNTALSV